MSAARPSPSGTSSKLISLSTFTLNLLFPSSNDWQHDAPTVLADYDAKISQRPSSILTLNHEVHQHSA